MFMYNDIYMKGVILENRNKGFRAGGIVIKDGKILLMRQFLGPRAEAQRIRRWG